MGKTFILAHFFAARSGLLFFFFLMVRRPPRSTLFPYRRSSDLEAISTPSPRQAERSTLPVGAVDLSARSEEHTPELQSQFHLVCRLLLEKKKYPCLLVHLPPLSKCSERETTIDSIWFVSPLRLW